MSSKALRRLLAFVLPLHIIVVAGCTPTVVRTGFPYKPSIDLPQGSGSILVSIVGQGDTRRSGSGGWILGEIRTPDGKELGEVVSDAAPEELVMRALTEELQKAGYSVERVTDLRGKTGAILSAARVRVDETVRHVTLEAKADAGLAVEIVRDGKTTVTLKQSAVSSKAAPRGTTNPADEVLADSVRAVLREALPAILTELRGVKKPAMDDQRRQ